MSEEFLVPPVMFPNLQLNLSCLPAQRDYLEGIGNGNRSAGFRKVLAFINMAIMAKDALDLAIDALVDDSNSYTNDEDRHNAALADLESLFDAIKELTPDEQRVGPKEAV